MANDLVLLAQWRERLQRLSLSGMAVEAFCRHEGISASRPRGVLATEHGGVPKERADGAGVLSVK